MKIRIKYEVGSETLQRILLASLRAESNYDQLKLKTSNKVILEWLDEKKEYTTDFILKVLTLLEEMDIEPQSKSAIRLRVSQFFSNIKSLVIPPKDELVIRECLNVDSEYLRVINELLKSAVITDELYQLYQSQADKIRMRSKPIQSFEMLLG